MGLGEVAAEQAEGEGVAVDLPASLLQLSIVGADGRGPGAADAELVQQAGAIGLAQVAQVVADDRADGVIVTALVFRQVLEALAGGEDAQARLAGAGQLGEQGLQAGGAQLAGHRAGRVLQRLRAVQHQQVAAGGHRVGQELALVPGREGGVVFDREPAEGIVQEAVIGGLTVVTRALAEEAPAIHPLCPAPAIQLEAVQPALDQ